MKQTSWFFIAALFGIQSLAAQTGTITGRVLDAATLEPIDNVNVVVIGTVFGTSSRSDGTFSLTLVPSGAQRLQFSVLGYTPQRRTVSVSPTDTVVLSVSLQQTVLPGQTIVVTATRGRERETPLTFSTLTARNLSERSTTQDIPQLLGELPSTTFYSENGNGIGYNYLNIRGFDQRRISVMVNGIPQNDPEDHNVYWIDFPDLAANLQDVQVQRGGGSVFYGPAAIGGSVNLITRNYAKKAGIDVTTGLGSFNTRKNSFVFNSGLLANTYSIYARYSNIKSDGYRERSWTDLTSYFLGAVRYDESMTTQLNFYGGPIKDGLAYTGIPKDLIKNTDLRRKNFSGWSGSDFSPRRSDEIENFSQPHVELLHEWRLNDDLTLNNAVFLVTGNGFFDYDGSWAPYSYYRITQANGFPVTGDPDTLFIPNALIRANVENIQYGWLPRLLVRHDGGELTLGSELRIHRSIHWGALRMGDGIPGGLDPTRHYYEYRGGKDMFSLYARELYQLQPNLSLLVNLQLSYNKYRLFDEKYVGTDFSVPYIFLNPRLGVNYNLDERVNFNVQISRTSREPRLKNLYDAAEASTPASWGAVTPQFSLKNPATYDFADPLVRPEHLTNVEVGAGYTSDDFLLSANAYYMVFEDEIVKNGQLDRFGQPITGNAQRTLHQGIELTAAAQFLPSFEAQGNVTISRNRLQSYTVYSAGQAIRYDGNPIAGFPNFLANGRITYRNNGFVASAAVQHVGPYYTDNTQSADRQLDAYTIVNASLAYSFALGQMVDRVELQLQVNNCLNLLYAQHGEGVEFFPGAERNYFATLRIKL